MIGLGVGHVYSGRPARGLAAFLIYVSVSAAAVFWLSLSFSLSALLIRLSVECALIIATTVDAVRWAKAAGPEYERRRYNRWYIYLALIIAVGAFSNVYSNSVKSRIVEAFSTPTDSMAPSVISGDHVLLDKKTYRSSPPQRGDLAAFVPPPRSGMRSNFLKRIVGLPGETIEIRMKRVFINGEPLAEPYVHFLNDAEATNPERYGDSMGPTTIPADSYFMLGDSRDNSNDSRFWGTVSRDLIFGKARTIFFSSDPETNKVRWERIGKSLDQQTPQ